MKKHMLFLALLAQFITSCSNDDKGSSCQDSLPAITTTGANTFGCCINGNLLIPRDGAGTFGGSDSGFTTWGDPTGNNLYTEIDIKDYKSDKTGSILIHIQGLNQTGIGDYIINESNGNNSIDGLFHTYLHCRIFNAETNSYQYYRSSFNSGMLKITNYEFIPGVKKIVSGTFNCTVINSTDSSDVIEIKDGRFDFDGATLPNAIYP